MWMISVALLVLALALLYSAPAIARTVVGDGDPGGLTRVIQGVALALLVLAAVVLLRSPVGSAFPPPPE